MIQHLTATAVVDLLEMTMAATLRKSISMVALVALGCFWIAWVMIFVARFYAVPDPVPTTPPTNMTGP